MGTKKPGKDVDESTSEGNTEPNEPDTEEIEHKYGSPAVSRAIDILEFMSTHPRPYGVTELSRCLNIPKNTIFRILRSLSEKDYAIQDPITGEYQLSTRVFTLGMSLYTRFELRQRARPHLEWLCKETAETCQIQTPQGDKVLVMDTISPAVQFYLRVTPGGMLYYHPNAFGKVIIAFMPEEEVNRILPPKMAKLTPKTLILRSELIKQCETIRRTGLAYDDEEYTLGVFCIGAPVFGAEGKIAAGIGITALKSWFDLTRTSFYEQEVLKSAYRVSKDIGYIGDYFDDKVKIEDRS